MGVAAVNVDFPWIQDQKTMGLIACHPSRPRHVPSNLANHVRVYWAGDVT